MHFSRPSELSYRFNSSTFQYVAVDGTTGINGVGGGGRCGINYFIFKLDISWDKDQTFHILRGFGA